MNANCAASAYDYLTYEYQLPTCLPPELIVVADVRVPQAS